MRQNFTHFLSKGILPLFFFLAFLPPASAQRYDRESFVLNLTYIPEKLIYDQVKTYGISVRVNNSFIRMDHDYARSLVGGLNAFNEVDFRDADMQIRVSFGPYSFVEEKLVSRKEKEDEKEKGERSKDTATYYKRVHSFRYPVRYSVTNRRNGYRLYYNEFSGRHIRTVETAEYTSEAKAIKVMDSARTQWVTEQIDRHIRRFTADANGTVRRLFDFFPITQSMTLFQLKKWPKEKEYNEHIKNIKRVLPVMTADELPSQYAARLKADLDYLKSFEGAFRPKDKKEDVLYFGNYYNLATIYYCLDDLDRAKYYLAKLDSVRKKEEVTRQLWAVIGETEMRVRKHFLPGTHLNYNPVTDYRLSNVKFISDALTPYEAFVQDVEDGVMEAKDVVITADGKEKKGKVFQEWETGALKFIPASGTMEPVNLTPANTQAFSIDGTEFETAKSFDGAAVKSFYRVYFRSDRIKLLQLVNPQLEDVPDYTGILRPGEDYVTYIMGLAIKKKLEKYFEDCPVVSKRAADGVYGGALTTNKIVKYMEMCADYSDQCGK